MFRSTLARFGRLAPALLALAGATIAYAQASVVVEVRSPGGEVAEGEVVLTPEGGGTTYSCRTSGGRCTLSDVPGGRYVATLRVAQGDAPSPRSVMIPPNGRVTLRVSTK